MSSGSPAGRRGCTGPLEASFVAAFGHQPPRDRVPLLLHPQRPASHARHARAHGCQALDGVLASPTASYRSVLAWRPGLAAGGPEALDRRGDRSHATRAQGRADCPRGHHVAALRHDSARRLRAPWPGLVPGTRRSRRNRERSWLAAATTAPLDPDPHADPGVLARFAARRGRAAARRSDPSSRRPPRVVRHRSPARRPTSTPCPSSCSNTGCRSRRHSQNVLLEVDEQTVPTGRMVLRDLSDTTVSIPLRLAKRRPFPALDTETFPVGAPFRLARLRRTSAATSTAPGSSAPTTRSSAMASGASCGRSTGR